MKGTPLIDTRDPELIARGYNLGLKVVANLPHAISQAELEHWESHLGDIKEALERGFALENIPVPVAPSAFTPLGSFELTVSRNHRPRGYLDRFRTAHQPEFTGGYHDALTHGNYGRPTHQLVPGKTYMIKLMGIQRQVSSADCYGVYREHKAYLTGAPGVAMLWEMKRDKLLLGKATLSFDEKSRLWTDADGNHRVPYMYRYSDGSTGFDLGSLGFPWVDFDVLVLFCDLPRA
ncbi:MAG TPA: hypothetical protein VJJ22_00295 [Candidatus Paceibacterota bacterium]